MQRRPLLLVLALLASLFSLTACDSPEEKESKYIQRGNTLFAQESYEKARVEYKNAARINPTSAEVRYRLGLVDEATGDIRNAFLSFLAAEQQDPRHADTLLKLAQYYLVGEQYEQVIKRLDAVSAFAPDNAQAYALRAALFLRQKNLEGVEKEARLALEKDSANVTAFTVLAGLEIERKNPAKAAALAEEAIARNPQDLSLLLLKAMIYESTGNMDKVAEAYDGIFRLKPQAARFRADLASLYLKTGKKDEAEKILRKGVADLPESKEMKRKLVDFLAETQGVEAAEAEIKANIPENETVFWLADLYIKHKNMNRAIALLEEMVAQDKAPLEGGLNAAKASLARLHFVKGDKELAQRLAAAVLEKDSNNPEALFIRANLAFEQGYYQNAVSDLRTIIRDNPKASNALQLLAETLLTQGHLDLAIDTLNQLVAVDPANKSGHVRLAQLFGLKGENKRALAILEMVNKSYPDLAVGWESTARVAIGAKDFKTAEAAIAKLGALEGQKMTALFLQGRIDALNGREGEALGRFKQVVLEDPRAPLAEHALAAMLEAAENESQLRDAANFMAGLPEPTPYLLTLLGETYMSLNNPAEAATQLDKAIAMSPSFQEPYIDRAKIFMAQRKREEALTLLQKAKAAAPADLRAPMAAADILGAAGDYRGAIAFYEEILARNPKADIAANNMAQLIADYQNEDSAMLEKARIAAERFISATNPLLLDTLAWVHFRQGNIAQAQTIMERVMSFGDKLPPQIFYHQGALLAKQGKTEEAKAALQKALASSAPYSGIEEAKKLFESLSKK